MAERGSGASQSRRKRRGGTRRKEDLCAVAAVTAFQSTPWPLHSPLHPLPAASQASPDQPRPENWESLPRCGCATLSKLLLWPTWVSCGWPRCLWSISGRPGSPTCSIKIHFGISRRPKDAAEQRTGVDGFLIKNVRLEKCLHASSHEMEKVALGDCKPHSQQYQWSWATASRAIINLKNGHCLTVHQWEEFALAQLEPCGASALQAWVCSKKGHLSLQGLGLHLSTKPGGHKIFLSREKDKFSRWKTAADEIICAADLAVPLELSNPTEESVGTLAWVPKSKSVLLPETLTTFADPVATSPNTTLENKAVTLSIYPRKEETSLGQERHTHYKKHAGNQRKGTGSRFSGTSWKTVMLVLCPLAFILGLIILALNIHYNKKKKMLSALKSRAERGHKLDRAECLPFPGTATGSPTSPVTPVSPSLKHGEILIEWKDGTVTPLFDSMNYQIC